MKIKFIYILILIVVSTFLSAQAKSTFGKKYLIIDINKFLGNMCKTVDSAGKEIYLLNARYKLKKNYRSWIQDDADFMFTFYILPKKKLNLLNIKDLNEILHHQINNIDTLKSSLLSLGYESYNDIEPILKSGNQYYSFKDCNIFGQAFDIQENSQYFPKYGTGSNRFELNLLSKPYSLNSIDSLRKIISKDSTSLVRFGSYVEDFYDKWFILSIDRQSKMISFWIDLKTVHDSGFSFGRLTSEITYKVGIGIIDFKIIPFKTAYKDSYFDKYEHPIKFNFKEFVDLRKLLI